MLRTIERAMHLPSLAAADFEPRLEPAGAGVYTAATHLRLPDGDAPGGVNSTQIATKAKLISLLRTLVI